MLAAFVMCGVFMINAIKRIHSKLVGPADSTILQARIFHEMSIVALIGIPAALLVNFSVDVPFVNTVLISSWVLIVGLFINSRYFGNLRLSVILFTIGSSALLAFNYFINSGINGPTLLLYLLSLVFTISVMPAKQYFFWIPFNLVVTSTLILIEYYNPEWVDITYNRREALFIDIATTYFAVIVCITVMFTYLIKNYQREKSNALNASIALRKANDSKTRLLSILSHDLRSPLNSIQGFLEVMMVHNLSPEERMFMEKNLLKETKNTQTMLHNLLNWSKSQMEGGTHVNLTSVSLHEVVTACMRLQETVATEKNVHITTDVNPQTRIVADLDMLKLVIRNIVSNAIKFTPAGGEIRIYSNSNNGFAQLHVHDNGIGIPPEKQHDLFSLGAVSTYGTDNEKGVGLGLMLCKEFTELQGGRIFFESMEGVGTRFTLEFVMA